METQLPPPMVLYRLATAHYQSQAVYVAAKLGIADHLADGPQTHDALAKATGTHSPSLRRVLRLLAAAGVVNEREDGRFELTAVGSFLKTGPGSFRAAAQLFGGPMVWQSWGDLLTTVRTGETALHRVFKTSSFEYFEHHPDEAAVFDEAMGSFTAMTAIAVAGAYDFSSMRKVVDVGGGQGALLAGILRANPKLHGVVFDLPRLADGARRAIAASGVGDRLEFAGGDFFEAVPPGADAYMLKHVIHDWDDAKATRILETCRAAMGPETKLLIVEGVYPPRIDGSPESEGAARNDVNMMVCTGGRQRSEAEFRELYAAAGLQLNRIVETGFAAVIEGVRA